MVASKIVCVCLACLLLMSLVMIPLRLGLWSALLDAFDNEEGGGDGKVPAMSVIWLTRGSGWTHFAKVCDVVQCPFFWLKLSDVISFEWSSAISISFPAMAETFAFNADIQQLMSLLATWETVKFQTVLWLQIILLIFCQWFQFKHSRNREKT